MPPFLSRVGQAARHVLGLQTRSLLPPDAILSAKGYGVPQIYDSDASLRAFSDNVWLYRSVLSIALEIARIKFRLQTKDRNDEITIVKSHQALETLRMPQLTKGGKSLISSMDLKLVTLMHLLLGGEGFWRLDERMRVSGAPTRIDLLLPSRMRVRFDEGNRMIEYRYRIPGVPVSEMTFLPEDVVHFKIPDPNNWVRGHAPTQGIRYALDAHLEADKFGYGMLANGAVPSGTLGTDKKIDVEERKKFLQAWKQMFGGGGNAGKTAFLPDGISYNPVQQSNQEMQFIESKSLHRDEILANYGVGPEVMGKTNDQSRANAEAAIFVFMRFGVLPFLEKFTDTLNSDYLPAFPGTEGMEFAYDDPVPENRDEKRADAQALFAVGAATPNELRKSFGFEPINRPGMDDTYIDLSKIAIGDSPPTPDLTKPNTNKDPAK